MTGHEEYFQDAFIAGLQDNGWVYSGTVGCCDYDKSAGVIVSDLKQWLILSQPDAWKQLCIKMGNEENAMNLMLHEIRKTRLQSSEKGGGTYNLLISGLKVKNIKFEFFQNKPVSPVSPARNWKLYDNLILRVVKEFRYSQANPFDAIDLGFFLNGIVFGTNELKNSLGKQGLEDAEKQYRNDRNSKKDTSCIALHPSAGALFHLASSTNYASLTTALLGDNTYFIPFNTGINNTEWHKEHSDDYSVSYLWKDVLPKENICQILFTMMRNIQVGGVWQIRFPRYHQFDNLRKIIDSVKSDKGNKNYLSQHAPGSGKSDEIANLAYALSNLQDDNGNPIYEKVIVVTNRNVLDKQLKELLHGKVSDKAHFKHIGTDKGFYDSKSDDLSKALTTAGAPRIIAVTAQTFSDTLLTKVKGLATEGKVITGRFAIIIDEAHDGETGKQHQNMFKALLGEDIGSLNAEVASSETDEEETVSLPLIKDEERKFIPSLNFFAYTATPNADALRVFGEPFVDDSGKQSYRPFHTYSMHQARDEGYINDVLANYVTYDRFFTITLDGKEYKGDKVVNFPSGRRQIGDWLDTHPDTKRDIIKIIMRSVKNLVIPAINGSGKAMLSCSSRLEALIYQRMIQSEIAKLPAEEQFKTLVAFSGSLEDPETGQKVTELSNSVNPGLTKNDIAKQFEDDEYKLLIVADKYQVGFDQPKLMCMFLDKPLRGINLVQTTARVNRKIKDKEQVYIFDFVNDREDVQESFRQFDEDAVLSLEDDLNVKSLETLLIEANRLGVHTYPHVTNQEGEIVQNGSVDNQVDSYNEALNVFTSATADNAEKAVASKNMSNIMDDCASKFHQELESSDKGYRTEELYRYRLAMKKFVSTFNLIAITRDGKESFAAIYEKYGTSANFFAKLSDVLIISKDDNTKIDLDALRLKKFVVVENGSVIRENENEDFALTESYDPMIVHHDGVEKTGPVEVLINEINDYPEFMEHTKDEISDFVDLLREGISGRDDLYLLAKSNNEYAFSENKDVKGGIIRLLSRHTRSNSAVTSAIAKKLAHKDARESTVINHIAKRLHPILVQN